ncbi:MAG: sensor histidine kinase [Caldilineaceae bacterium]|jgi:signal transduction histidine kinase
MAARRVSRMVFLLVWILAPVIALLLAIIWLQPGPEDFWLLAVILVASELASLALGGLGYRLARRRPFASVHLKIGLTYSLGLGVMLINLLMASFMMFISTHDLALLSVLIVFSTLVALGFGSFVARSMTGDLDQLVAAAERVAAGDLTAQAEVRSGDEVEMLADTFNYMVRQLDEAEKREREGATARRTLIAGISHDLRAPLTSMQAMVEAIEDGVISDPAEVKRYLRLMRLEVQDLSQLAGDLFELTQLGDRDVTWEVEPGSLRDLISDTLGAMQIVARDQGVVLTGNVDPDVDPVLMNTRRMQRALYNLLDNGIRHTPAGGSVSVAAWPLTQQRAVHVEVADTGFGIPESDLQTIFEPYRQVRTTTGHGHGHEGGGAGLGLAIAAGIIEAHGGTIGVESRLGEGSRFAFVLPQASDDRPLSPTA